MKIIDSIYNTIAYLRLSVLWGTMFFLVLITGMLLLFNSFFSFDWILSLIFFVFLWSLVKEVPAGDPEEPTIPLTKGIATVFGKNTDIVVETGYQPFFPFIWGVKLVNMQKKNEDILIENIRCKAKTSQEGDEESGGEIKLRVGLTSVPDEGRYKNFTESGGSRGTYDIIVDMLTEEIRQAASVRTWEEMTFAKDDLTALILLRLTENAEKYAKMKEYEEALDSGDEDFKKNKEATEERKKIVREVLGNALSDGVGDVHDLGLKILRLNITKVEPMGNLKEESEKIAIENQQAKQLEVETDATVKIAKKYIELGVDGSTALDNALAQQNKIEKKIVDVKGGGGDLSKAAALLSGGVNK